MRRLFSAHLLLNYQLDLTKLGKNGPYMALLVHCISRLHSIWLKLDVQDENFISETTRPSALIVGM